MSTRAEKYAELRRRAALSLAPAGQAAIDTQRARGKRTARERIDDLVDDGSFTELDRFVVQRSRAFGLGDREYLGDGVVTGRATIDGRMVFLFAQDFTVLGGSLGEAFAEKVCKIMDLAVRTGAPVIGINDSGGARIQEGVASMGGYAEIFFRNVAASGVIPQISLMAGPCAGGATYSPAITDFIIMTQSVSQMFITGPEVVKAVTGETVSFEQLGGATTHSTRSGVAQRVATDETALMRDARALLSYLPQNNRETPARLRCGDDPRRTNGVLEEMEMRAIVADVLDDGAFFELRPTFAESLICGFGRIDGRSVGVVANDRRHLGGALDSDACIKGARFVRFCDAFNIPLLTFADNHGFHPSAAQEHGGIIRRAAMLLYAYAEATVPKVAVVTRNAHSGAYGVVASKHLYADCHLAWDSAGARSYVDAVIASSQTRSAVANAFDTLQHKRAERPRRKHGNIPL